MDIHVIQDQTDLPISAESVQRSVQEFVTLTQRAYDEVSIHFISDEAMRRLHQEYFDDPSPTDCISFPMDSPDEPGYKIMGEVFVCPQTAISYTQNHGGDVYQEATLYMVHGLLHLIGYNDLEENDCKEMRIAEAFYIQSLRDKNLCLHA